MIAPLAEVRGKTAFITGGASGIGLGLARACLREGMNVILADIREDALDGARAALDAPDRVHGIRLDVTDYDDYVRATADARARFGNIHLLVGNAGIGQLGPILDTTVEDWDFGLNINLKGVINGILTIGKHMRDHDEGGQIVSTASMAAVVPVPNATIYTAAKAAVIGLTESMRAELEPLNIGASVFCPGPVESNLGQTTMAMMERAGRPLPAPRAPDGERPRAFSLARLTAEETGDRVLAGLRRNDLYIFTHREFREGTARRMEAMVAAYPSTPEDEARAGQNSFLTANRIFDEAVAAAAVRRAA